MEAQRTQWRWLVGLLMIAFISTLTLSFVGLSWIWPVAFGVGMIIAAAILGNLLNNMIENDPKNK